MKINRRFVELIAPVALLALCIAGREGLAQAALAPVSAAHIAQTATAKPILFEVVSVRLHKPGTPNYGPGFTDDGLTENGMGVRQLMEYFGVSSPVQGLPEWSMVEYDIHAKVAEEDVAAWKTLPRNQKNLAVQAMMADRFKLKFHRETRQVSAYALVVAKGGPKFKEAVPGDTYPNGFKGRNGSPVLGSMMETRRGVTSAQAISMAQLANFLSMPIGKPVVDKTGLTGLYDLTIKVEEPPPAAAPPSGPEGGAGASDPAGPIFTMLQEILPEQLGLRLVSGVTAGMESLVIDHVEKPTEN